MPRPRHQTGSPQAAEALVRTAPLVSRWIERLLAAHDPPLTVAQYLALQAIGEGEIVGSRARPPCRRLPGGCVATACRARTRGLAYPSRQAGGRPPPTTAAPSSRAEETQAPMTAGGTGRERATRAFRFEIRPLPVLLLTEKLTCFLARPEFRVCALPMFWVRDRRVS